jgi:hypothetical protein
VTEEEFWKKLVAFLEEVVFCDDSEISRKAAYLLLKEIPAQRVILEVVK